MQADPSFLIGINPNTNSGIGISDLYSADGQALSGQGGGSIPSYYNSILN
jgi:hypothetical protein